MKLVSYRVGDQSSYGIWKDDGIVDLKRRLAGAGESIRTILDRLDEAATHAEAAPDHPHDTIELLVPVPDPAKILCVGLNYKTHIAETGRDAPSHPILFPRYPSSLVASGQDLVRPHVSSDFDFEGELAFVIGRGGRHIGTTEALAHVAGFACFNDGSVRDWQRHTSQFLPGKTFWRSGSFGPWLVTPDEVGEIGPLTLTTRLNDAVMQQATLDDLLFGVPELIAYISTILPLEPGDVVATGTTGGVGLFRKPPVWMKPGDRVEVEIEGLGTLVNGITDER
ncbi:fumarylacetoacetate hydrolase family protein [Sphingomonas sp.]|uniref:fumarylacetoacetate hydrolase family protein n=1 Tax=Sphingomonas sp. TaxID=28214 RepID=UPI001817F60E|nr:fumarylacetoacetate hydrolase family protein [Sphingomonas sp.]MBA4761837.1 fumarylacetoacetate hydrolase family protein [Sphingomonas sp.]